jgi:hypothetical protein
MKRPNSFGLAVLLLLLGTQCDREPSIEAFPRAAAPGETVRIQVGSYRGALDRLRVTVAGQPVHIVRAVDGEIEILLPVLATDSTTIAVRDGDRTVATAGMRILPPRSRRLLISVGASGVRLVQALPSAHAPTGTTRTRRTRLSFDVVNRNNVVVYSGAIPHPGHMPAERFVAHDSTGAGAKSVSPPAQSILAVYIPTPGDSVSVEFFEAGPGLDLGSSNGRAKRRSVGRFEVTP